VLGGWTRLSPLDSSDKMSAKLGRLEEVETPCDEAQDLRIS
jgi:hypothetical protein